LPDTNEISAASEDEEDRYHNNYSHTTDSWAVYPGREFDWDGTPLYIQWRPGTNGGESRFVPRGTNSVFDGLSDA
jgi:hypothetical protein